MAHSDSELIKRTLDGDETAFGFLVDKYKGAVHALAYRKIGDFHTAEEITQDTFLQAYQKLSTLKDWRHFPGWLYTIASRFCLMWHRKHKLPMQSIDAIETGYVDALAQAKYVDERTRQTVHSALDELPESQRTVLTLHYLGGMTCEEIARFIGTSRGAILDRLYRARLQLKKELIPMMRHTLGAFQLPSAFTKQMMNRIDQLRLTSTPSTKPLAPWLAVAATLIVAIFIGLGQQSMTRSQRPYSLDAPDSTVQVVLIDTPTIFRSDTKPALTNRPGRSKLRNDTNVVRSDSTAFGTASNTAWDKGFDDSEWVQTNGPTGGDVAQLFRASDGTLYATTHDAGVFRSDTNGDTWVAVNDGLYVYPYGDLPYVHTITETDGVIYLKDYQSFYYSNTRGESWDRVKFPDKIKTRAAFAVMDGRFYISQDREGVVYSEDSGKSWTPLSKGLSIDMPDKLITVGTTLFAKIGDTLFRLRAGETSWTNVANLQNFRFLIAARGTLVIGSRTDLRRSTDEGDNWIPMTGKVSVTSSEKKENVREFRFLITVERKGLILTTQLDLPSSTRKVEAWIPPITAIDGDGSLKQMTSNEVNRSKSWMPTEFEFRVLGIEGIAAFGDTVHVLLSNGKLLRSTENGRWTTTETELRDREVNSMVALSEHTVCFATSEGVFRWTDDEKFWRRINEGLTNTFVYDLASYKNALYATTGYDIVKSVDGGHRWTPVHQGLPVTIAWAFAVADGELYLGLHDTNYGRRDKPFTAGIYRLADDQNSWIPVQTEMRTNNLDHPKKNLYQKFERLQGVGELVISGNTFYAIAQMGSGYGCYKWRKGEQFWTRISPEIEAHFNDFWTNLVVSGKTIYLNASRNLMYSNNRGKSWSRIDTYPGYDDPNNGQIEGPIIMGNTIYIAVYERGVFRSADRGKTWESVNDGLPQGHSWELFSAGNMLFAAEWETGIFQLKDDRTWVSVKPYPPHFINAMEVVDGTLYAATGGQGVYRIGLDKPEGK